MRKWKFYHGTSQKRYESIQKNGFLLTERRFHNFLATQGVYLVPNRPLIARRFAKQSCREDFSAPIVLQVSLNLSKPVRTLDLTSDIGMNRFYEAYVKAKGLYSVKRIPKLGSRTPLDYVEYLKSVEIANQDIVNKLDEADRALQENQRHFNWDTVALDIAVDEDKIQLIIAAIYEGNTFNRTFSSREPNYHGSPHYNGIRARDHLEVCITDLSIINLERIVERPLKKDEREFDPDFIGFITNIDALDAISGH